MCLAQAWLYLVLEVRGHGRCNRTLIRLYRAVWCVFQVRVFSDAHSCSHVALHQTQFGILVPMTNQCTLRHADAPRAVHTHTPFGPGNLWYRFRGRSMGTRIRLATALRLRVHCCASDEFLPERGEFHRHWRPSAAPRVAVLYRARLRAHIRVVLTASLYVVRATYVSAELLFRFTSNIVFHSSAGSRPYRSSSLPF